MYLCLKLSADSLVKKALTLSVITLFFALSGMAQYANSWINFSQQYYKVPIVKDGIYRISVSTLQSAGFPVTSVDPRVVQLIHRGVEQAIVIQGESDARFDTGDYIEFYGQRNDGTRDSLLYFPSSLRPHPYYNLFSDTAAYFLTWNQSATRGKRMTAFFQNNTTSIPKEISQIHNELMVYANEYSGGNTLGSGEIQQSFFDQGEGWTDKFICYSPSSGSGCVGFTDYTIGNLSGGVTAAGNPSIDVMITGRDELNHVAEVWVGQTAGSLRMIASLSFSNFEVVHAVSDLNWSDLGSDGKMVVEVKALGSGGLRDKLSVSYIKVTLPQSFDVTGLPTKKIQFAAGAAARSYVEFTTPSAGLRLWDITDPDNLTSIGTNSATGIQSAVIPNATTARTLLLSSETTQASLQPVTFTQVNPASYDYLIITNSLLLTGAQTYAAWRSSSPGGSYSPLTITVDQLYNQFNYGETSPLAIFQFTKFMVETGAPKYMFLIGKALDVSQGFYRKTTLLPTDFKDLVPTSGLPASDMAFSSNLKGSGFVQTVATGRLSASTNAQVIAYTNKIKEIETAPLNSLWHKHGLHLSGGILPQELIDFREFMDGFKAVAEGPYWGAKITTIGKHDPSAVKQINISDQVNAGVNMITFFGHSSPGTIDIDIGKVSDPKLGYNNPGKYPVFLINGCNAGNFFSNGTSFGEDWMLASGKGARGFIAHSFFGYVQNLKAYSDLFYAIGFADSTYIQKGIGDVQMALASKYIALYGTDITNITQIQQMVLLGDPAVRLFGTIKPDYETDDAAITLSSFDSKPVTIASDSFAVSVIVRNYGAVNPTPLQIRLVRTYSDGFTEEFLKTVSAVYEQDTIQFVIKKDRTAGSGNNKFTVTLDYPNIIKELDETNNTGGASFIIPLGGTFNLYPAPYGIVSQPSVDFIFQSVNPLEAKRGYDVQIDTVSTFDSQAVTTVSVTGKVLLKVTQVLSGSDSTVYYWRTRFTTPGANESSLWSSSSFTLIRNSPAGWTQRKFQQLNENAFDGLQENTTARKLEFLETSSELLVTTYGWNYPASNLDVSVKIDGTEFNIATESDPCRNNTLNFIAFNKTSLVPYPALDLGFQSINTCGREPQVINSFAYSEMDDGSAHSVLSYVDNVQAGDSVLVFSIGNVNHAGWTTAMRTKLQELGIDDNTLSTLGTGQPVVILGRKGAPAGTATVHLINDPNADELELQVDKTITGRYTSGEMNSVIIGPAVKWKQLISQAKQADGGDDYHFSLWGVGLDRSETLIQDNIAPVMDISAIDAAAYPWLRIKLTTTDETNLTPVQLSQWLVLYDPMAEGVLLFDGPPQTQVLMEGQPWTGNYKFVNISSQSFTDSLTVNFDLTTEGANNELKTFRIMAPVPGDTTRFSVTASTIGRGGLNDPDVFVNPRILPEQYYQNNEIDLAGYLNVNADNVSPLLDVTFDGRHLLNGDFVSSHPVIRVLITDDNKFLLKTDTAGVRIVLTYPCSDSDCQATQIYFSSENISWHPATATTGFNVEFTPLNLPEGTYDLFVQGADAKGNKSGPEGYDITFQVKNESTFNFSSVYPNPSATEFFFNFTLSGNDTPETFSMDIYSMDGRVVQQYGLADVNNFHIGVNSLAWDPRTENAGSIVGGGIYIYRINVTVKGVNYRESGKLIFIR